MNVELHARLSSCRLHANHHRTACCHTCDGEIWVFQSCAPTNPPPFRGFLEVRSFGAFVALAQGQKLLYLLYLLVAHRSGGFGNYHANFARTLSVIYLLICTYP